VFDVGQVGNLQPIVNRPLGAVTNRAQDAILPHTTFHRTTVLRATALLDTLN